MKLHPLITGILLVITLVTAVHAASVSGNTVTVTNPVDAAALVYVSDYEITPAVLYPGETGVVTVYVTNAANTSVSVSQPNLMDPDIRVVNLGTFATATSIGPGETIEYYFVITAGDTDGTYLPLFTTSPTVCGGKAIHAQIRVKIDSTAIRASIAKKPDEFSASTKGTVNVSVVNPREGDITNVLIIPETRDGAATITPDEAFVGTLKAGSSVQVPFAITPEKDTDVIFHVQYNNGDNKHSTDLDLPIRLGENKKGAEIVVNNIETTNAGRTITLKGDVTNNGLTNARSVLVTVGNPATPVNPNPVYAVGNLEPDDFSSFEVTYSQTGPGSVPILVDYKDDDGNSFSETFTFSGNQAVDPSGSAGSGIPAGAPSGS